MTLRIPTPTIEMPSRDAKPLPTCLTPRFRAIVRASHEVLQRRLATVAMGERILVALDLESGESLSVSAWHDGPSIRLEVERDSQTLACIERMYPRLLVEIPSQRLAEAIVTDLDLLLETFANRTELTIEEGYS